MKPTLHEQFRADARFSFEELPQVAQQVVARVWRRYGSVDAVPLFWGFVTWEDWDGAADALRAMSDEHEEARRADAQLLASLPRKAGP